MIKAPLPLLQRAQTWRRAARLLASHRIDGREIEWGADTLFATTPLPAHEGPHPVRAPKSFVSFSQRVLCHTAPDTPALLYTALLRHQSNKSALSNPADPLTRRLAGRCKTINRDVHKMHAFVRFRELPSQGTRLRFAAWFEPDHAIIEAAAPFFAKRFTDMDWLIATPFGTARFENARLSFHDASPYDASGAAPSLPEDDCEALWATYFSNIFNPARVKTRAMKSEMPVKYWKNLPETKMIPAMLQTAEARVMQMREALPTTPPKRAAKILAQNAPPTDATDSRSPPCRKRNRA